MAKKNTDDSTVALINEVRKRKAEIAELERPNFKTNCSFSYSEKASDSVNLHQESSIRNLLLIAGFLIDKDAQCNRAALRLGVEAQPFVWHGFSTEDWIHDIRIRIGKIQISSKKKHLENIETRLNSIMSPEAKAAMELEAIKKDLGL